MLDSSPAVLLVRHHQQWRYNWTTWSHAIFLKTHANIQYKALVTYFPLHTIFTICRPTSCSTNPSTFFCRNLMSAGLDKLDAIHYEVGIMALVLSQNGLRSNLRASNFEEFPGGTFYAWSPHLPVTPGCSWLGPGIGQNAPCTVDDFMHSI